ncbi:ArsR/SmtB family transcription factor [Acidisoma sp. 7E03]
MTEVSLAARATEVAELLKLLGHPQRLMIACLLAEGPFGVSEIEARLGLRQPSLSQQLGVLREAGVIEGRREAKAVIYHLAEPRIAALLQALWQIFCADTARQDMASPARPAGSAMPFADAGAAAFARLRPVDARGEGP